jgi:hypothetical protein
MAKTQKKSAGARLLTTGCLRVSTKNQARRWRSISMRTAHQHTAFRNQKVEMPTK